jgi:hypothetical protein
VRGEEKKKLVLVLVLILILVLVQILVLALVLALVLILKTYVKVDVRQFLGTKYSTLPLLLLLSAALGALVPTNVARRLLGTCLIQLGGKNVDRIGRRPDTRMSPLTQTPTWY